MHSREEAVRPEGVRVITVNNQRLRVAIRPGNGSRNPLLLMNGIGVNLELLQVFVDALDPAREVIRFDVPGIGGSPSPAMPYTFLSLAPLVGWCTGPTVCLATQLPLSTAYPGQHLNRVDHDPRSS